MMRFQWNALKDGTKMAVHDATHHDMRLLPGVVTIIDTGTDEPDIGIRVSPDDEPSTVRRPWRLAVHLLPLDPDEFCWRCAAIQRESAAAQPITLAAAS